MKLKAGDLRRPISFTRNLTVLGHVLGLHREGAGARKSWWQSCAQAEHSACVNRSVQQGLGGLSNARGSPLTGI